MNDRNPVSSQVPPPLSAPPRLPHVPPLSILYLLAWTTATAAVLLVLTRWLRFGGDTPLGIGLCALTATAFGWVYFGGLLILWHAVRRTLWPLEPGEWLILVAINVLTVGIGLALAESLPRGPLGSSYQTILEWAAKLSPAEFAAVSIVAAVSQRQRRVWSALFWTLVLQWLSAYFLFAASAWLDLGLFAFLKVLSTLIGGFATVLSILLLCAVITDWRRRQPRHWLHTSAAILFGLWLACMLAWAGMAFANWP